MKSRVLYLDIIRILACVMIVSMHAPIPNTGLDNYILSADSYLTAPGIGLFIMVSGALLLPVNMPTKLFLKKRLIKITIPTLFWTFFYMMLLGFSHGWEQIELRRVLSVPFSYQFGDALWFVYMLIGLYFLAPILSPWLKQTGRRELEFYLVLWAMTLCFPYIHDYIDTDEDYRGMFYYFSGYIGYFLLGYYLRFYFKDENIWKCLLLLLVPVIIATILKILQMPVRFYESFWYLSLLVAMMSVAWFLLVKRINVVFDYTSRLHRFLAFLSNCCFGIYLVHLFIMRSLIWHWTWLHSLGVMQILIVTFLTMIGSFAVTWLISYLPGAEYVIGFRQKR